MHHFLYLPLNNCTLTSKRHIFPPPPPLSIFSTSQTIWRINVISNRPGSFHWFSFHPLFSMIGLRPINFWKFLDSNSFSKFCVWRCIVMVPLPFKRGRVFIGPLFTATPLCIPFFFLLLKHLARSVYDSCLAMYLIVICFPWITNHPNRHCRRRFEDPN